MIKCFLNHTITVNLTLVQLPAFSFFALKMSREQRVAPWSVFCISGATPSPVVLAAGCSLMLMFDRRTDPSFTRCALYIQRERKSNVIPLVPMERNC